MTKSIKTKDKTLEVQLFEDGEVNIESNLHKNIGIGVQRIDPSQQRGPKGALYMVEIYKPEQGMRVKPFEYDIVWIMPDGTIVKRGEY